MYVKKPKTFVFQNPDHQESKASVGSRNIIYLIKKVESKWWTRLLKKEGKSPVFLKVDWNKWIDEDEQEEEDESNMNLDDINFSVLQMGGSGDDYGQALDDDEGKYYTGFVGAGKREYEAIGKWILYFGFTIVMMYDM